MSPNALRMVTLHDAWTAQEVQAACGGTVERLRAHGLCPGDRVALVAANSADSVITLLALMHLDVSLVLLDDRQDPAERTRVLHRARVRWLICDPVVQTGQLDVVERLELGDVAATGPAGFNWI